MKKMMLALAFSILIASAAAYGEEYKALVIGISEYDDKNLTLKNPADDAEAVAEIIKERYKFNSNNVVILASQDADHYPTLIRINCELDRLINESQRDQTVVIYYSGHGHMLHEKKDGKDEAEGYWLPADAVVGHTQTYLKHKDVIDKIAAMKSRRVLLISDSCYSGTLAEPSSDKPVIHDLFKLTEQSFDKMKKRNDAPPEIIINQLNSLKDKEYASEDKFVDDLKKIIGSDEFVKYKGFIFLHARDDRFYRYAMTSGSDETVDEKGPKNENSSFFTHTLVTELRENKEPNIKPMDIFSKISKVVEKETNKQPLYKPIKGDNKGEFVFSATEQALPIVHPEQEPFQNKFKMTFIYMKPGRFKMGTPLSESNKDICESDEQPHLVKLTGFFIQTTEVTQKQWNEVMNESPSNHDDCDDCPVEKVPWQDVEKFIAELNDEKDRNKPAEYKYELPTEAQWEYACRAGTQTPFNTGDSVNTDQANYNGNFPYFNCPKRENPLGLKTVRVRELPPNQWGLYGMHGNVWEWCRDVYYKDAYKQLKSDNPLLNDCKQLKSDNPLLNDCKQLKSDNPLNDCKDQKKVIRGGAWTTDAKSCRCAHRAWANQDERSISIGFRVVLVPKRESK